MKVVIAVNFEELESYISNIEEIEKSEIVRHKKNLIKACDELKPDVVFISNTLSGEEDIRQIINKLTGKEYTGIRIIYLYGEDDRERKKFINYLISRGIYDYHIGIEITPGDIQRLLFNPRTREQIKHDIIDDNESIENTENIEVMKEEKEIYANHLSQILEHAERLKELDTDNVKPTAHVLPMTNVFREDEVKPSLDRGVLLSNAPEVESGCFKVPKIVE